MGEWPTLYLLCREGWECEAAAERDRALAGGCGGTGPDDWAGVGATLSSLTARDWHPRHALCTHQATSRATEQWLTTLLPGTYAQYSVSVTIPQLYLLVVLCFNSF